MYNWFMNSNYIHLYLSTT